MENKVYDLEKRTWLFARNVRQFVKKLQLTIPNREDIKQVVRSSGSIGANYIEANESLGDKDFLMKIKICRKEAKETGYWLSLIDTEDILVGERNELVQEATELRKIFGAILTKSQAKLNLDK
ncbi:MAG: four helix bundle protein [Bacteroidetes bacterium 43-93]|nr:four helix bundle protein [Bacteroidota bacterium]OJW95569.1 MAG: four helix bundle protein [Bacteroidetes bacterium 43-93]